MNEALERMKMMRTLQAQIPVKAPSTKGALDFSSPLFLESLRTGTTGTTVSPEQALRVSAVYACIKVLAETISTLPCKLYKVDGSVSTYQDGHRLNRLVMDRPNRWQTSSEWWMLQVTNVCLRGNSYSFILRHPRSKEIVELLPLNPDDVSVNVQPGNVLEYIVTVRVGGVERHERYAARDILHFKNLSLDGFLGVSPIKYNSEMLSGAIRARDYANSVYTNGATPRGVLSTDASLSDEAYDNIRTSWTEAHGGTGNANRVAILEAGLQFHPISMTPDDVQLLDSRKLGRAEIAGIFRVPPHMIADLERSTFNNIEHQTLDFYKSSISPWLTSFQNRLGFSLTPGDRNLRFKFDEKELIRGDLPSEVESFGRMIELGVLNPNEVRDHFGYNPREGGDEYVAYTNNIMFGDTAQQDGDEPEQESDDA